MTPEQIEIERKKFETFRLYEVNGNGFFVKTDTKTGEYLDRYSEIKWRGWLACCESRDSLCVTLPNDDLNHKSLDFIYGYDTAIFDVQRALESAGINYRVEE